MSERFEIHRILVALDATSQSAEAFVAALRLAEALSAEIEGLFVEDERVMALAGWDMARHVSFGTGQAGPVDAGLMAAALQMESRRMGETIARLAGQSRARWSFRSVRGHLVQETMRAAQGADLLILAMAAGSFGGMAGLAPTAREAAEQAPASVLLHRGKSGLPRPLYVIFDGSPGGRRALAAALDLARRWRVPLTVLLKAEEAKVQGLARAVEDQAAGAPLAIRALPGATIGGVCGLVNAAEGGILVIDADNPLLGGDARRELLETIACPVLLVR
jgi:nucleotide-binding universal stress UspA family protein